MESGHEQENSGTDLANVDEIHQIGNEGHTQSSNDQPQPKQWPTSSDISYLPHTKFSAVRTKEQAQVRVDKQFRASSHDVQIPADIASYGRSQSVSTQTFEPKTPPGQLTDDVMMSSHVKQGQTAAMTRALQYLVDTRANCACACHHQHQQQSGTELRLLRQYDNSSSSRLKRISGDYQPEATGGEIDEVEVRPALGRTTTASNSSAWHFHLPQNSHEDEDKTSCYSSNEQRLKSAVINR